MDMKRTFLYFFTIALIFSVSTTGYSQRQAIVQEGEFGITAGAAHYFGDLNTRAGVNRPKPAVGVFFRKQFNNYISARVSAHFAQLGYSDIYSDNQFQKRRNLSFNTNIWELAIQGDFNFYQFIAGDYDYRFTPYLTFGVGVFNYDPFAFLNDEKHFLRPLGTEGQGSPLFPDLKPYNSMAGAFPVGMGVKYSINDRINLQFEIAHRFTTTDYLDDVSTTYAGAAAFPPLPNGDPSVAFLLQDRSYETGTPIGVLGQQRGVAKQKDQYVIAEFGITFNLTSYKCPPTR